MKTIISLVMLFILSPSFAKTVAEVPLNDAILCGEKNLPLQGAGLRTATIFNIKIYVTSYYSSKKITKDIGYTNAQLPVCFEITYLRDFDNADVDKAWKFQFEESSDHPYAQLNAHVATLQTFFGEIKGDRKHVFALLKGSTQFFENGVLKGEIKGDEFQKNFLSIWFGKKPPTKDLQQELLSEI